MGSLQSLQLTHNKSSCMQSKSALLLLHSRSTALGSDEGIPCKFHNFEDLNQVLRMLHNPYVLVRTQSCWFVFVLPLYFCNYNISINYSIYISDDFNMNFISCATCIYCDKEIELYHIIQKLMTFIFKFFLF